MGSSKQKSRMSSSKETIESRLCDWTKKKREVEKWKEWLEGHVGCEDLVKSEDCHWTKIRKGGILLNEWRKRIGSEDSIRWRHMSKIHSWTFKRDERVRDRVSKVRDLRNRSLPVEVGDGKQNGWGSEGRS